MGRFEKEIILPPYKTIPWSQNGFVRGYSNNIITYLTFDVNIRTSNLWVTAYSNHQQFLYDTISEFRDKDWTFKQIAGWLNDNGYTSARGKKFGSSHVHSIIKKRRLRDQHISKESKMIISNFDLWFWDRTLTNQIWSHHPFFHSTLFLLMLQDKKTNSHIHTVILNSNVLITFLCEMDEGEWRGEKWKHLLCGLW